MKIAARVRIWRAESIIKKRLEHYGKKLEKGIALTPDEEDAFR